MLSLRERLHLLSSDVSHHLAVTMDMDLFQSILFIGEVVTNPKARYIVFGDNNHSQSAADDLICLCPCDNLFFKVCFWYTKSPCYLSSVIALCTLTFTLSQ